MDQQPPKRALQFLRWFCREDYLEEIEGNLIELYEKRMEEAPHSANSYFYWQVLLHFRPDFIRSFKPAHPFIYPDMIKHYFKVGWRNLMKQKLYSSINIFGLALGLTCFLLIFLYVRHERSFDRFYENDGQIYRVIQRMSGNEYSGTDLYGYTTVGLAPALKADFPEVGHATTIRDQEALLSLNNDHFYEKGLQADAHFFQVFRHPLLLGDAKAALAKAENIVLTASLAQKIFGNKNPLGESVIYQNSKAFTVSGVMKDLPSNSSLQFSFLTPMLSSEQYVREMKGDSWNNNDYYTFFTLSPEADPAVLQAKMQGLMDKYMKLDEDFPFELSYLISPLSELHFETKVNFDIGLKGNRKYASLLFLVSVLVLLLACVNYMNLAIARSIKRTNEVGLRKVVGAMRRQLLGQFLGESVMIAFLGFGTSLILVQALSPFFGYLLDRPVELRLLDDVYLMPGLLGIVTAVGLIAGSYPAFLMSGLRPIQVLHGRMTGGFSGQKMQGWLLVGQYAIAIVLIISSLVIYSQFQFIQQKELGYNKDQVVIIPVYDAQLRERFDQLKKEWEANPNILSVTATSELPTNITSGTVLQDEQASQKEHISIYRARVDHDYLDVFDIALIAGRDFSPDRKTDQENGRIINETAAKVLGWTPEEAIGKPLKEMKEKTIIGVVKDFHMHSMHTAIAPLMLQMRNPYFEYIAIKVRPESLGETIGFLEKSVQTHSPYPFEYTFLDEQFNRLYQSDVRLGALFGFFTILSILIASLGLFGMAAFVAKQRTKEIGIRKVLGASVNSVVAMLSKDFLKMVMMGYLIAIPIAWYGMGLWLQDFAYRIELEWWMFVLAGLIAMTIAFLTVSAQSLKAAHINPVKCLKDQ